MIFVIDQSVSRAPRQGSAETGGRLRVLDITRENVRKAIRSAESAKALYESDLAVDY